jgi:predicted kinase
MRLSKCKKMASPDKLHLQTVVDCYKFIIMNKQLLTKPVLIIMYGFPGSGKTFFSRQFSEEINAANINDDQLRFEFFENPNYSQDEDDVVDHLSLFMVSQFLQAGVSVVYDANSARQSQRRILKDIANRAKAETLIAWFQIDIESAFLRVVKRDRRKVDDKYNRQLDRTTFESLISRMQNPGVHEDYVVISGKHNYVTHKNALMKKLYDRGLVNIETAANKVVKPELSNRIPNLLGGRVDAARRNISIR